MKIVFKRSMAILLSLIILISCCAISVLAANEATIIAETVSAQPGETIDVNITVKNNPGIAGMTLGVNFDSKVLALTGVKDGGVLGSNTHKPELVSPYTLSWSNDTATQNISADGIIATLQFTVKGNAPEGNYPISLSYDYENYDIYNVDIEPVSFKTVNGAIVVHKDTTEPTSIPVVTTETQTDPSTQPMEEAAIIVQNVTAQADETVDVNIYVANNPGIAGMTLRLDFDSKALNLEEVIDGGILGESTHKPELTSPYTLSWSNDTITENIASNGTIATLRFKVNKNADKGNYPITVSYDYDNYDIYDVDINSVSFKAVSGTLTVTDEVNSILIGDSNGDGIVTITDATTVQKAVAEMITLSTIQQKAADANADGIITIDDVTMIQKYIAELIDHLG